jgi:hypothetical protein
MDGTISPTPTSAPIHTFDFNIIIGFALINEMLIVQIFQLSPYTIFMVVNTYIMVM